MAPKSKEKSEARQAEAASDEERRFVRTMAGYGIAREDIARAIRGGVPVGQLAVEFAGELNEGQIEANAKVAESLFNQAIGKAKIIEDGKMVEAGVAPVASAAIFWLKTHGWSRAEEVRDPGVPGAPLFDPTRLSYRELERLETLLEKATAHPVAAHSDKRGKGKPKRGHAGNRDR